MEDTLFVGVVQSGRRGRRRGWLTLLFQVIISESNSREEKEGEEQTNALQS